MKQLSINLEYLQDGHLETRIHSQSHTWTSSFKPRPLLFCQSNHISFQIVQIEHLMTNDDTRDQCLDGLPRSCRHSPNYVLTLWTKRSCLSLLPSDYLSRRTATQVCVTSRITPIKYLVAMEQAKKTKRSYLIRRSAPIKANLGGLSRNSLWYFPMIFNRSESRRMLCTKNEALRENSN